MGSGAQILLVEGEADRAFFERMCQRIGLANFVRVAPPKELEGTHNSKEGVFNYLPTLLEQLKDGQLTRLAVVVDADCPPNGGFSRTLDKVTKILTPFGYDLSEQAGGGLYYTHNDGLADFGLWVMPDNSSVGMLEDWIKLCLNSNEKALFSYAEQVVSELPSSPKFKPIHLSKAEVATWLAWQKKPGHGLYIVEDDDLIDTRHSNYLALTTWLRQLFL